MTSNPPIAIIVPTRNSSSNISRLMRSLRAQTYSSWRVVFVDASTNEDDLSYLSSCLN